jgi:hypothetical protein
MLNATCKFNDATDEMDSNGPCVVLDTTLPAALDRDAYWRDAALKAESNLPLAVAKEPE